MSWSLLSQAAMHECVRGVDIKHTDKMSHLHGREDRQSAQGSSVSLKSKTDPDPVNSSGDEEMSRRCVEQNSFSVL